VYTETYRVRQISAGLAAACRNIVSGFIGSPFPADSNSREYDALRRIYISYNVSRRGEKFSLPGTGTAVAAHSFELAACGGPRVSSVSDNSPSFAVTDSLLFLLFVSVLPLTRDNIYAAAACVPISWPASETIFLARPVLTGTPR